jgi:FAD binding domain
VLRLAHYYGYIVIKIKIEVKTMNAPTHASHVLPDVVQRNTPPALIDALKERFGERCSTALAVREHHGKDESSFTVPPPSAVVFAESTADVATAIKLAAQYKTPVIPFGVGSSLEGHLLAIQGGISIDVSRMNQVLRVNAEDLTVTVQPGVTRKAVNEAVKSEGLFFPIDPRQRHERGALRHDARKRAGARSCHRQRRGDSHRHASQKIICRLRLDTLDGRLRRHTGRDDGDHPQVVSFARGYFCRRLLFPQH